MSRAGLSATGSPTHAMLDGHEAIARALAELIADLRTLETL
jgi:hypothetical protein